MIAEALKEKQLFAIAVKDVDDLLFNCEFSECVLCVGTMDRRLLYPNLLKRVGGEFAKCADVIYSVLTEFDWRVCYKHETSPCCSSSVSERAHSPTTEWRTRKRTNTGEKEGNSTRTW